jgi:Domain of unknown function (DUF222)
LIPGSRPVGGALDPDPRTPARRADALVEVCHIALASGGLPDNGGQPAQPNVTVDVEALRRGIAVGHLDTGALLAPSTVRRLAGQAQILPIVLDGTDRHNGVAVCGYHHRLIHHSDWTVRLGPDPRPEFLPTGHLDPTRQPQ